MRHRICKVKSFAITGPYSLSVGFDDGLFREIDFSPILQGELYGPLRDLRLFEQVMLDSEVHTLVWPNGADFDPATLHDWPSQSGEINNALEDWRQLNETEVRGQSKDWPAFIRPNEGSYTPTRFTESEVIEAIKAQYVVESNERFLHPAWRQRHKEDPIKATGYGYLATQAYYELMEGEASGLTMKKYGRAAIDGHYWIEKKDGEVVDLTAEQYKTGFPHYKDRDVVRIVKNPRPNPRAVGFTEVVRAFLEQGRTAQVATI
jgi:hypothetical protein